MTKKVKIRLGVIGGLVVILMGVGALSLALSKTNRLCFGANNMPNVQVTRTANEDYTVTYYSFTGKVLGTFSSPGDLFWKQSHQTRSAELKEKYAKYCVF